MGYHRQGGAAGARDGAHDRARHGALRVLGLRGHAAHLVEPDEAEELIAHYVNLEMKFVALKLQLLGSVPHVV